MTGIITSRDRKVLVTGATGFIGRHLCAYLLDYGFSVRALIRHKKLADFNFGEKFEQCFGDILDSDFLASACEEVDVIVHLAGSPHVINANDKHILKTTVIGTEQLLTAAVNQKVQRFVFMSSSLASKENLDRIFDSAYGRAKFAAEQSVMSHHKKGNIDCVVLRPVNVYGRGMRGNIAKLINLVSRRLAPPLPHLETLISLIGIEDVCEATRLAITSEEACGKTYTLTDGIQYVINDIEKAIYREFGRKVPKWRMPITLLYYLCLWLENLTKFLNFFGFRAALFGSLGIRTYNNLVEDNLYKNEKIKEELGFNPKTTFYCALPEIVDSLKG